ncbi:hypothetical protein Trydic_g11903 [Trypoxylus dichotomus]
MFYADVEAKGKVNCSARRSGFAADNEMSVFGCTTSCPSRDLMAGIPGVVTRRSVVFRQDRKRNGDKKKS